MANISRTCAGCGHHMREQKGSVRLCKCDCHRIWRTYG
jgi:hypothetical protein